MRSPGTLSRFVVGFVALTLAGVSLLNGAEQSAPPRTFICVLHLAERFHQESAWTKEDQATVQRHFARLKAAAEHGPVILAGRTDEPADKTLGIVIFEAPDATVARAFMDNDPAVKAGIMTAELHPYMIAVQRQPQGVTTR